MGLKKTVEELEEFFVVVTQFSASFATCLIFVNERKKICRTLETTFKSGGGG